MEFKDYYNTLGVAQDADQKAIKKAYRKLARELHPDVNPGNQAAEEKFKDVNEAYQVLSDPEQRKKYDELRAQYQGYQRSGGRTQDFNWQPYAARPGEGVDVQYGSPEDLQDIFGTESPYSDFFNSIFGGARTQSAGPRPRRGRDIEHEIEVTLEEAFRGGTRLLQIGNQRIEARIPPGVRAGSRIRLARQGEPGRNGGPAGNLYLVTRVLPDPRFEREGDDLYTDVPVDIYTAVLGGEVRVPTPAGAVMLTIPPQTQAGRSFRLRGQGMPRLGHSGEAGDLYARVTLTLPKPLTDRELNAFRELAEARQNRQTTEL